MRAVILGWLVAVGVAQAQTIRHIDVEQATGRAGAVIVPWECPLLHTAQLVPTKPSDEDGQIADVLGQLDQLLAQRELGRDRVVKLNFVVAGNALTAKVEKTLAKHFDGPAKPAVSFVAGKLPRKGAVIAVDAVIALRPDAKAKVVEIGKDGAVLPPGARVWISGQAEKGADLAEATRKTVEGLRESLKFVGLSESAIVQLKAFLQPMADVEVARRAMETFFDKQPAPPLVFVEWKSSLPIEIELVAWAGAERATVPIEYLTPPALKPSPVYTRIVRVNYGKLIYVSGLDAAKAGDAEAQITDVFATLGGILNKAGSDYRHLAKATYYVTDAATVKKMGELRPRYYDPKRPPAASLAMVQGTGRAERSVTLDMIAVPAPDVDVNDYSPPEHGHGLTAKDAADGWISLFDGQTTFGWRDGTVENGLLVAGTSTTSIAGFELKADVVQAGTLLLDGEALSVKPGLLRVLRRKTTPTSIGLRDGLALRTVLVRPRRLQVLFNGKDLAGWKRVDHPTLAKERWPTWSVKDGLLRAVGGPGALESDTRLGDGALQIEAKMNWRYANGGVFFRAIAGDFMNGYEAQLYNRCIGDDPSRPFTWATGAIDDRQNARRLVSRDGAFFVMTIIAHGPHIATWVNGHQTVDWTDTRPPHVNARQGLRVEAGALQLQAHDPGTDITFRRVEAATWR
jgi:enamine deaminase RidA (YjgF/YER057c/UK114 family)